MITSRLSPDACGCFFEGNFGGPKNRSCAILNAVAFARSASSFFMKGASIIDGGRLMVKVCEPTASGHLVTPAATARVQEQWHNPFAGMGTHRFVLTACAREA